MRGLASLLVLALLAPVAFAGGVQLTLSGPASAQVGQSLAYAGAVLAPSGAPLRNHDVSVAIDGASPGALTVHTDSQGRFTFQVSFDRWVPVRIQASSGNAQSNVLQVDVTCGSQACSL